MSKYTDMLPRKKRYTSKYTKLSENTTDEVLIIDPSRHCSGLRLPIATKEDIDRWVRFSVIPQEDCILI